MLRVKLREAFLSTAKAEHLIATKSRVTRGLEAAAPINDNRDDKKARTNERTKDADGLLLDMGCLAQLLQNLQVYLTDPVRDAQVSFENLLS